MFTNRHWLRAESIPYIYYGQFMPTEWGQRNCIHHRSLSKFLSHLFERTLAAWTGELRQARLIFNSAGNICLCVDGRISIKLKYRWVWVLVRACGTNADRDNRTGATPIWQTQRHKRHDQVRYKFRSKIMMPRLDDVGIEISAKTPIIGHIRERRNRSGEHMNV